MNAEQIAGWFPAVVFPLAGILQFVAILRSRSSLGVSILTWSLFAAANVCMYVYVGKHAEPQAIIGFLGTAVTNVLVVITALVCRGRPSVSSPASSPQ